MSIITPDLIDNPALWRLSMLVTDNALEVVLYSPVSDKVLIYRRLPYDQTSAMLKDLQDVVVDNPLLIADFKRVNILIDTPRLMVQPAEIDPETRIAGARQLWPDPSLSVIETTDMGRVQSLVLDLAIDSNLLTYLQRTFPTATISHSAAPLIAYFGSRATVGNSNKMYVYIGQRSICIIVFRHGTPTLVSRVPVTEVDDIVYYVLAAAESARMSLTDDEILLCGDTSRRDTVSRRLREFARYVMPVIFPAEVYRAGRESLLAPFELVVLPMCV